MTELNANEKAFLSRVALVMIEDRSLSIESAMKTVLKRDEELFLLITSKTEAAQELKSDLSRHVYKSIRKGA